MTRRLIREEFKKSSRYCHTSQRYVRSRCTRGEGAPGNFLNMLMIRSLRQGGIPPNVGDKRRRGGSRWRKFRRDVTVQCAVFPPIWRRWTRHFRGSTRLRGEARVVDAFFATGSLRRNLVPRGGAVRLFTTYLSLAHITTHTYTRSYTQMHIGAGEVLPYRWKSRNYHTRNRRGAARLWHYWREEVFGAGVRASFDIFLDRAFSSPPREAALFLRAGRSIFRALISRASTLPLRFNRRAISVA